MEESVSQRATKWHVLDLDAILTTGTPTRYVQEIVGQLDEIA
jgi:hypothetical protein